MSTTGFEGSRVGRWRAAPAPRLLVREPPPQEQIERGAAASMGAPRRPRLLDQVRQVVRARHYSRRTEKAYVFWIRRYILYHGKRHPSFLGEPEITEFLSSLVTK